jgi:hypothetical protein
MRYTAIQIFEDGSFLSSRFYRHAAMKSFDMADNSGKLREFFEEHKYVIVPYIENPLGTTYMLFREEHPMFNLPVLRMRTYLNNNTNLIYGPLHDLLKELLKHFNNTI